jgi:Fe-S-cluster-containing hydrogenase component 2
VLHAPGGPRLQNLVAHEALSREHKVVASINEDLCVGCGACVIACRDGAHQALSFGEGRRGSDLERVPVPDDEKCIGCGFCGTVCPVSGCITMAERMPASGYAWDPKEREGRGSERSGRDVRTALACCTEYNCVGNVTCCPAVMYELRSKRRLDRTSSIVSPLARIIVDSAEECQYNSAHNDPAKLGA